MKERAYPLGGMKWLAGLIALPALLVMAIIFIDYVEDPRPLGLSGGISDRESMMGPLSPDGSGMPRKDTSVASDTSYQSKSKIEKYLAGLTVQEAWPYLLGIVAALVLLMSMVVLGIRRLRRRYT